MVECVSVSDHPSETYSQQFWNSTNDQLFKASKDSCQMPNYGTNNTRKKTKNNPHVLHIKTVYITNLVDVSADKEKA